MHSKPLLSVRSRSYLLKTFAFSSLAVGLASCGEVPEGMGGEEIGVTRSAASATSTVSRGPRFTTPVSAGGDHAIISRPAGLATLYDNGNGGYTTHDLNSGRPATLSPIDVGEVVGTDWGDFNGDGRSELAIGVRSMKTTTGIAMGGFIVVRYAANGTVAGKDFINVPVGSTPANYGASVAAGDFNGDGYDDLIVTSTATKAFRLYMGGSGGLTFNRSAVASLAGFGASTAAGDFNCDGFEDFAIGAPDATSGGRVQIYKGNAAGTVPLGITLMQISGERIAGDGFGKSLAAGNFDNKKVNGRPCVDLAVGVPYKEIGSAEDAGEVLVFYGNETDPSLFEPDYQYVHQDRTSVTDAAEPFDFFGTDDLASFLYMELAGGACGGDAAVHLFAGLDGYGLRIIRDLNRIERSSGHDGLIGSGEKGKLMVIAYQYSGTGCPADHERVFAYPTGGGWSTPVMTVYSGSVFNVSSGFGEGLTHSHPGYIR
jgi:hypothetical protein